MPPGTKEAKLRQRMNRREREMGNFCGRGFSGRNKKYRKFTFPNFLTALMACAELTVKGEAPGKPHSNPLYVYYCGGCGGIHIGHLAAGESVLMYGAESVDIRKEQNIGI